MSATRFAVAGALAAITLLGYFVFPGHTYLHSDTQIYVPILEHLRDHSLFTKDLIAQHPHVAWTCYDEAALLLSRLTGADFEAVLTAQQLLYRLLGFLGVYLLARHLGLERIPALGVTWLWSLGTQILGPAVLLVEYEPVPRGYAVPLLMLALAGAARERFVWASIAGSVALLYHPPTVVAVWLVYGFYLLWRRQWVALVPPVLASLLLYVLSRAQTGLAERQDFLGRIPWDVEQLQRLRGMYNWVSLWDPYWWFHYPFYAFLAWLAWRRLIMSESLRWIAAGLVAVGVLSIPLSYVLLEIGKWTLVPQLQPGRAALWVIAIAMLFGGVRAWQEAAARRYWQAGAWFAALLALPVHNHLASLFADAAGSGVVRAQWVTILVGAAVLTLVAAHRRLWPALAFAAIAITWTIPTWAGVQNYPNLNNPDLAGLSQWARTQTGKESVFAFPDANRDLRVGVFRVRSQRAVYIDWKSGGQVNFLWAMGREWSRRFRQVVTGPPLTAAEYRALGIDYIVLQKRTLDAPAVFRSGVYTVYALR